MILSKHPTRFVPNGCSPWASTIFTIGKKSGKKEKSFSTFPSPPSGKILKRERFLQHLPGYASCSFLHVFFLSLSTGGPIMKKRVLLLAALIHGLFSTLLLTVPCWGQSGNVAYTRYKWGSFYISPGCCNSILAQDYDCLGQRKIQPSGIGCYNTGSGDWMIGTCGGGCVSPTCGGVPTKLCVINQPNIGCGNCDVFLSPMPGSPASNCTSQVEPACSQRYGCGTPGGYTCYTLPFDGSSDLDSGFLCDRRSAEMIAAGCRPDAVLSCLSINTFSAEATAINLSAGQKVNFTGSVSSAPGGSINWSISVAGKVLTGSGNSITQSWDGKDSGGKQVMPGMQRASRLK
jgi:hypothetical protein